VRDLSDEMGRIFARMAFPNPMQAQAMGALPLVITNRKACSIMGQPPMRNGVRSIRC